MLMHTRTIGAVLLLSAAPLIAAVQCNPDPIAEVPEFSPLNVKLEPDILDRIVAACDPVSAAADNLSNLLLGAQPGAEQVSVFGAAGSVSDVLGFAEKTVAVAGGIEAHLLSCSSGALWDGFFAAATPTSISESQKAYAELESARAGLETELAGLKDKQRLNQAISFADKASLASAASAVLQKAQASVGALSAVLSAVATVATDPGALLRSDEMAVEVAASVARENIANLGRNCAVARAQADVQAFVTLGQQSLTAVRLAQARAGKLANRDAGFINARLTQGLDWQRDPQVAQQGIALGLISADTYRSWSANLADQQQAMQKRSAIEGALGQGLALCNALQQQVRLVEQRRIPFQALFANGKVQIAACRLDDATRIITQLQNLEGSECGPYLAERLLAEAPADRSGLLGPTDSGAASAVAPGSAIPPSAQLRLARDLALAGCARTVVPPPLPPPTVGGPLTPGAADIELILTGAPEVPPVDVNWPTVSDGAIKYVSYLGSPAEITGDFTWGSPAATIGAQGITITATAACNSVHDNTFATGIGITAVGLDVYVDGKKSDQAYAEAPINCGRGEGLSKSVSVQVVPRAGTVDGATAQIRIGPFWAGSVKYNYQARKIAP